jgi:hypothetical protein
VHRRVLLTLTAAVALASALVAVVFPSSAVVATARTVTPPMGWNDGNAFGCAVDERDIVDGCESFGYDDRNPAAGALR